MAREPRVGRVGIGPKEYSCEGSPTNVPGYGNRDGVATPESAFAYGTTARYPLRDLHVAPQRYGVGLRGRVESRKKG